MLPLKVREIKTGRYSCHVGGCGGDAGCVHEYIPYACPTCGRQMVRVKTTGFLFCPYQLDICFEGYEKDVLNQLRPMVLSDSEQE